MPSLHPPHGEIPLSFWEHYGLWIWVALGVLGAVVVAVRLLRKSAPPLLEPPAAQARRALGALAGRPEDGALLGEVSRTLKAYLALRLWLPPGEMTTSDFCRVLGERLSKEPELALAIGRLLRECDGRRFGAGGAAPLGAAARALEFVEKVEAQQRPQTVP